MNRNVEIFKNNLEFARRKAGGTTALAQALQSTVATYHQWKKFPPKSRTKLLESLANFVGLSYEELFTQKLMLPPDEENESIGSSVERVLRAQEMVRELRHRHTWKTLNFWVEKVDELLKLVDDDMGGLKNLVNSIKPTSPSKKEESNGPTEQPTEPTEQAAGTSIP